MIDYKGIVEEMVKNKSIKSGTSIEYKGNWYFIEIRITKELPSLHLTNDTKERV